MIINVWIFPGQRASPFVTRTIPLMNQPPPDPLSGHICTIRGQRVILDADLARLYGTTTKRFNEAFRRNMARFPTDFAFQLTSEEFVASKSQTIISNPDVAESKSQSNMWSQFASTSKPQRRRLSNRPWAFTEHGAVMAANILRSPKAVGMSVYVVRAFIAQREALATNVTILKRLAEIDKTLLEHNSVLLSLWKKLRPLLAPPPELPRKEMGFHASMKNQKPRKTVRRD